MADEFDALKAALRAMAEADQASSSPQVEARLVAEFRTHVGPGPRFSGAAGHTESVTLTPGRGGFAFGLAMAAALLLALAIPVTQVVRRGLPPTAPVRTEIATAFLPLPYATLPAGSAHIVRLR